MKTRSMRMALLCLAAVAILASAAAPAKAIIGGTQDATNTYCNVGMIVQWGAFVPGQWGFSASCTLVRNDPGNVVVLCAAHQLVGWAATDNAVTFESVPDFGWVWTDATGIGIEGAETYPVIAQAVYPSYAPTLNQSRLKALGPGQEDVALMWLADGPVKIPGTDTDMPTSPIVGLHGLDTLELKSESFTAVGYGLTKWLRGSDVALFAGGKAVVDWDGRNYKEVSVVTENAAFSDRYLQLSVGQADNDSGSPLLHDGTIVAVCSFSSPRQAPGCYDYRLDTYAAQEFLSDYGLVPVPPVE